MQGPFLRKYGVETKIPFVLYETDGLDFKVDAAHASGDTTITKDEGSEVSTTNGFVDEGTGYSITISATEMQAARIVVFIVDQGTKAWMDDAFVIETYGDSSAQHAFDLDWEGFTDSGHSIVSGTVDDGSFSPTTTAFESDLTDADGAVSETTADHFNGRIIIFTSGNLKHQATRIEDYEWANSNGKFTVVAMTEAPANGDTFVIL